jgi:transcriptional regulator with GAF, ATPase, and Fis domain
VISSPLIGQAPCVRRLRAAIERFAPAPYSVLIEGESGSGKELVARDLHARSTRSNGPMVCVNCGALAADVIESELFGHEKGAFTGAVSRRRGVFEEAHEGTLFLDEIGELPLSLQPKLLRVLETGELRKVGAERTTKVNVRVVSATLRDLEKLVQAGRFREDLFFRLSDFRLTVPPLRERRADIPALVEHLLARIAMDTGRHVVIEDRALSKLLTHSWPGNVRELLSTLKRAVYLAEGQRVGAEHIDLNVRSGHSILPPAWLPPAVEALSNDPNEVPSTEHTHEIPRDDLAAILAWCNGNLSRAAQMTGMPRSTIRYRLARPRSG